MLQTLIKDALKEWAVTIRALDQGEQVLLLRKGGIREKEFKIQHDEFLFYPTYEHQKSDLLKPEYQQDLVETLAPWGGVVPSASPPEVTFTHYAQVDEVMETMDPQAVEALSPHYIWTTGYAEKRLYWRPFKPLEVIFVRVFRLAQPARVPVTPYFLGCKSWVDLPAGVSLEGSVPVIEESAYRAKVEMVKASLSTLREQQGQG